ncbi:hypothetical protein JCM16303_001967 [Sporobolomyces ruberrimus]
MAFYSALGKEGWTPPRFSKDEPRRKFKPTFTEPLCSYFPPAGQHPDEEKGRSIRSVTRIPSNPTDFFSSEGGAGLAPGLNFGLSDDSDAFLQEWAAERRASETTTQDEEKESNSGLDFSDLSLEEAPKIAVKRNDAVDWTEVLAHAVDHSDGKIILSHKQLTRIPDSISDLSCVRKISAFPRRTFERNVQSTPSIFSTSPKSPPLALSPRPFCRSSSIASSPSARAPVATAVPLDIDLAGNQLTSHSLSNALFGLDNLRCLWLRKNELEQLPPGIGRLTNLVDLSLSTNQLEHLPAEILRLENLATLTLHPNPFLPPPSPTPVDRTDPSLPAPSSATQSSRLLGPLTTHFTVPSLREIALRKLLETDPSNPSQRLIQRWESVSVRDSLPSHDYAAFISTFPPSSSLNVSIRSDSSRRSRQPSGSSSTLDFQPSLPPQPYDPLANVCQSPLHPVDEIVFFQPAVERIEWVEERLLKPQALDQKLDGRKGPKTIPIKWRGCSARCLDWLEEAEEEEEAVEQKQ